MLNRLLDDAKVGWIAAVMDLCIHEFCAFRHFHSVDLRSSEHPRGMLVSNSCNLTSWQLASYIVSCFCFELKHPISILPNCLKNFLPSGRDVLRKGTALSHVLLRVCPGCRASGSPRAAAFGCYDGGDRGPNVPGYQRHRKGKVVEKVWSEEQARHVLLQCVSALSLQGVRRR